MFPQNQYPNFTNFPYPSFPQEVVPPDSDPDAGDMICVTYSRSWTAVLMSACNQLIQLSSWKGTPDEKKLAAQRATNLQWMLQNDIGCDMGCCYDVVSHRITGDGGMEISINGGEWIPDPEDPRITAPTYPPITMDEAHTKCDAATNASVHIQSIISETSSQLGGTGSIIEIAAAIALAIFALFLAPESIPALVPVILPLIAGLLFVGQAAWDAYFDDTVDMLIVCALYCNIEDDGTFTQEGYDGFIAQLVADMPANAAKDMFISLVSRIGLVGLNDYAAIGTSADADCTDCVCGDACNLENWIIRANSPNYFGNVVSRNETTGEITVETDVINTDGSYYVLLYTNDADICCTWITRTDISGTVNEGVAHIPCGTAFDFGNFVSGLDPVGQNINAILMKSTVPFSVKIQLAT